MTTGTISPLYGDPSATAPAWPEIDRRLTEAPLYWLATVRSDGRPHAVPLCGVWRDGAFFFCTGDAEQKMRNLEHDPHVVVTAGPLGADGWGSGKDIAVEGVAERVDGRGPAARRWPTRGAPSTTATGTSRCATDGSSRSADQGDGGGDGAVVFRVAAEQGAGLRRRARPDDVPVLTRRSRTAPTPR